MSLFLLYSFGYHGSLAWTQGEEKLKLLTSTHDIFVHGGKKELIIFGDCLPERASYICNITDSVTHHQNEILIFVFILFLYLAICLLVTMLVRDWLIYL